jgi:hypothetical protein
MVKSANAQRAMLHRIRRIPSPLAEKGLSQRRDCFASRAQPFAETLGSVDPDSTLNFPHRAMPRCSIQEMEEQDQVDPRPRHQDRRALQELQGREHQVGRPVAPGVPQREPHAPVIGQVQAVDPHRRTQDAVRRRRRLSRSSPGSTRRMSARHSPTLLRSPRMNCIPYGRSNNAISG